MKQRSWLGASVLGALVASITFACSSQDAPGGGLGSAGTSNGIGGSTTTAGTTSGGSVGVAGSSASAGSAGTAPQGGASAGQGAGGTAVSGSSNSLGGTGGAAAGGAGNSGGASGGGSGGTSGGGTGGTSAGGGGTGGTNAGGGGSGNGGTGNGGGGAGGGGNNSGPPTAEQILGKLGSCNKVKGPFNPDGPDTGNIDVCQTGSVLWWKADMDVDCDGIQTPPCDTDNTGQPQTSIVDLAPSGDVDPTKLPYFVIPLGSPESEWYTAYGVELGQIGAIIYKGQVIYGIFADQAGGNFIGEASYKMCSLFIGAGNCDPNNGGIDPLDVTYVTFTGTTPRASDQDIYNHDKHTALGEAAAKAWLGQ